MLDKGKIIKEIKYKTTRSSGSGGQNVNKVSTKVELRFDLVNSLVLTEAQKSIIFTKLKNRISSEGILIITSDSERTQPGNKKKVRELFLALLEQSFRKPKSRIKTKPTKTSREKRLKEKKINSEKKKMRKID